MKEEARRKKKDEDERKSKRVATTGRRRKYYIVPVTLNSTTESVISNKLVSNIVPTYKFRHPELIPVQDGQ